MIYTNYNISLTDESLKLLESILEEAADKEDDEDGPIWALSEYIKASAEADANPKRNNRDAEYIAAARQKYEPEDTLAPGDFSFDDEPEVNAGPHGAYVQGWFWIPKKELKKK